MTKMHALLKARKAFKAIDQATLGLPLDDITSAMAAIDDALTIDYAAILERTKVEIDEYHSDAPWEDCDGFEHDLERIQHDGQRKASAYVSGRDGGFVRLQDTTSTYDYFRGRGASKQVAREKQADANRAIIKSIVHWRTNGWNWYSVVCKFHGCIESLSGIDDEDYAQRDVVPEIADQMVYALEQLGYSVTNKPSAEPRKRERYSHINEQNRS